ncbi:Protein FLX-like 3, partial [Cucurbita argyrosperma subsp. argyrosperma]
MVLLRVSIVKGILSRLMTLSKLKHWNWKEYGLYNYGSDDMMCETFGFMLEIFVVAGRTLSMAGRNRSSRHIDGYRVSRDVPRSYVERVPAPLPIHPAALEEELELQHREMQRIISDNRMVIDDNTILQRELSAAKEEIHRLNQAIPKVLSEKEAQSRELLERGLKLEAELRASEPLKSEVLHLRGEIQKLNNLKQDLSAKVQSLTKDVTRLQAENQQLNSMRADMDGLLKELIEARFEMEILIDWCWILVYVLFFL